MAEKMKPDREGIRGAVMHEGERSGRKVQVEGINSIPGKRQHNTFGKL